MCSQCRNESPKASYFSRGEDWSFNRYWICEDGFLNTDQLISGQFGSSLNNEQGKTKFIISVFVNHQSEAKHWHQSKLKWKIPTLVKMLDKSNNHDVIGRSAPHKSWFGFDRVLFLSLFKLWFCVSADWDSGRRPQQNKNTKVRSKLKV